ncbi:hypothetical protein B296_00032661 [Ensete ventricosum]|uniref:Uncharacterized protein n=1 Tax=Ensete ventricosum TaxID=4639 RepID=A0A426Z9J5_ENSVE|nr:hypothetical protein B296_00032661 [Ensete ventricosum]
MPRISGNGHRSHDLERERPLGWFVKGASHREETNEGTSHCETGLGRRRGASLSHCEPSRCEKTSGCGEEHPPPAMNAPAVKGPTAAGEGHSVVKKLAEEHPAGTSMASVTLETINRLGEKETPPFISLNRRLKKQPSPFPCLICHGIAKQQ